MPTIIYGSGNADFHTPLSISEGGTGGTSGGGQAFPLGMIIPIASNLTGTYTIPASGSVDNDGWMYCNGAAIPAGKNVSGTTPNLTDGRFLRGSTSSGSTGGSATFTLATTNIPSHTHTTSAHTHSTAAHVHSTAAHVHSTAAHTHTTPAHSHSGSSASAGNHSHAVISKSQDDGTIRPIWNSQGGVAGAHYSGSDTTRTHDGRRQIIVSGGAHSHGVTINSGGNGTSGSTSAGNTGSSSAGNTGSTSAGNTGSGGGAATGATGSTTAVTHLPIYVNAQYLIKVNA